MGEIGHAAAVTMQQDVVYSPPLRYHRQQKIKMTRCTEDPVYAQQGCVAVGVPPIWLVVHSVTPHSSRITSPAAISPAAPGTKAMLPGVSRTRLPAASVLGWCAPVRRGNSVEYTTFS